MTLEEYVLRYKNAEGEIVANIFDYYDRIIRPLRPEYNRYNLRSGLVMCWYPDHFDRNASMGDIPKMRTKGGVFNCLGCHKHGNVIDMHMSIQEHYFNHPVSREEAARAVAELFNIPMDIEHIQVAEGDFETAYEQRLYQSEKLSRRYDRNEFTRNIRKARERSEVDLEAVNDECVKMIATIKDLYD